MNEVRQDSSETARQSSTADLCNSASARQSKSSTADRCNRDSASQSNSSTADRCNNSRLDRDTLKITIECETLAGAQQTEEVILPDSKLDLVN